MNTGTAPAWQVREAARQKLLEGIQERIIRMEDHFDNFSILRALLPLLNECLVSPSYGTGIGLVIAGDEIRKTSSSYQTEACRVFRDIVREIKDFQRSDEEGLALFATLFEWVVSEIAQPYHMALRKQEVAQPNLIFHAPHLTHHIPIA